jgi:hypothetical protein
MRKGHQPTDAESMPEAEVTLRVAFWLLDRANQKSHADIAIDGANVRIAAHEQAGRWIQERTVFDIRSFLAANKCYPQDLKDEWRGTYSFEGHSLRIRSVHGFDVQLRCDGKDIKAECKGGPLQPVKGRSAAAATCLCNRAGHRFWLECPIRGAVGCCSRFAHVRKRGQTDYQESHLHQRGNQDRACQQDRGAAALMGGVYLRPRRRRRN